MDLGLPFKPSRFVNDGEERRIRASFEFFPPATARWKTLWNR